MTQRWANAAVLAGLMIGGMAHAAPDLSGVWQAEKAIYELKTVEGKAPPLKPEAAKVYDAHKSKWKARDLSFDPTARCISPGLPRMLYLPYPFEIIQRPQKLTYLFQWNYWNRHVYLTDKAKEVPYPLSLGLSHAKWQGDTLVITTTDLRADNTLLDSAGMPRSESMKITETLRLVDKNTLEARFTFDDPQTFTRPWDTDAMAAGVTLRKERLAEFRAYLESSLADAVEQARRDDALLIDGALSAAAANLEFCTSMMRAGPFGAGNPDPVFVLPAHTIAFADVVGQNHIRVRLRSPDGAFMNAIAFRAAATDLGRALIEGRGQAIHAAGQLSVDRWQGNERVQMRLIDVASADRIG